MRQRRLADDSGGVTFTPTPFTLSGALCWLATALAAQQPHQPAEPSAKKPEATYLRFIDLGDYRGRLEVAIVRYVDKARDVRVDLVGAVHIGEADYYAELSKRFVGYDAVLYELVAPEGTRPGDIREDGPNPVSAIQRGMQRMLGMEFQLDGIDYKQRNFVHADLSPDEMLKLWRERGESMLSSLMKMMTKAAQVQRERDDEAAEATTDGEPTAAPSKPRGREGKRRMFKWELAKQIGPMESMLAMFGDDDKGSGSVLVGERNKRAIEVLQRRIKRGDKQLAIFYGAAHMPDMAERLEKLGFTRERDEWLVAWDVGSREIAAPVKDDKDKTPTDKR